MINNLRIRADGLLMFHVEQKHTRKSTRVSDVSSFAQYLEPCSSESEINMFKNIVYSTVYDSMNLPIDLRYIIWIMFHTGCRINEVLSIDASNVNSVNDVKLKASKHGLERIVRIPLLEDVYICNMKSQGLIFDNYNRFYIYRLCKARGLYIHKLGLKINSVTHSFRAVYANEILKVSKQSQTTARAMGHKSSKTIEYYAKNSKK